MTLSSQIEKLKRRFHLQRVVMVGDRGVLTSARIEQTLRPAGLDWITGCGLRRSSSWRPWAGRCSPRCSTTATWPRSPAPTFRANAWWCTRTTTIDAIDAVAQFEGKLRSVLAPTFRLARYSLGNSEEILGRAIKDLARRDELVVATKVYGRMRPGPNGAGLSRKAIFAEIDNSLRRLGVDYVDLYQIHRFDHDTPIEETLEALHDVVKAGKARYIGASSMHAWQFARALGIAEKNGWTRFVSMQNLVNLLYREEEREMLPLCEAEGVAVIPWSPQARGKLSRDWGYTSMRTETDDAITRLFAKTQEADKKVVERVAEVASARGIPRAQVALAWLLAKPVITAPIVGATKLHHLDDALASDAVKLTAEEIAALEEHYVPHAVVGFV
jgi:aryl-alcohol dehydrogenase-like predicted oxidoreductase